MDAAIKVDDLRIGYGGRWVLDGVTVDFPRGRFTAILGANGCGKSTLLRSMVNLIQPEAGRVLLGEHAVARLRPPALAREIALLPQAPLAPEGITVGDLVMRGRFVHRRLFAGRSQADLAAVDRALADTGLQDLRGARVAALSGGQRQRVWLAMVLAQETEILLLDEPTSFLDIAHQVDLMQLLTRLRDAGRTIIAVLHDVNQAARYCDHLVALADRKIAASGAPAAIVSPALIAQVFGLQAVVVPDPVSGTPMVVAA